MIYALFAMSNSECIDGVEVARADHPLIEEAKAYCAKHNHPFHLMELAEYDDDGETLLQRCTVEEWEHFGY